MAASAFHFPFFSPLALSTIFASIGAWGLIVKFGFSVSDLASLGIALPAALLTAYCVTYVSWRLVSSSRGSSEIHMRDLVGAHAEVITPIPAGGVGEVAAIVSGERFNGPAREEQGRDVPRGARVVVKAMLGATLLVSLDEPPRS